MGENIFLKVKRDNRKNYSSSNNYKLVKLIEIQNGLLELYKKDNKSYFFFIPNFNITNEEGFSFEISEENNEIKMTDLYDFLEENIKDLYNINPSQVSYFKFPLKDKI